MNPNKINNRKIYDLILMINHYVEHTIFLYTGLLFLDSVDLENTLFFVCSILLLI